MMRYEEPRDVSKAEAEQAFRFGTPEEVTSALLGVTFYERDWRWVQEQCMKLARHEDVWVRRNAATCIGHIARFHRQLDVDAATRVLTEMAQDPAVAPWAEDALEEIARFVPEAGRQGGVG